MKILILALPRSGTKFAQVNMNFYLKAKYGITLNNPEKPSTKYIGFGELLNVNIALQNHHLTLENNCLGKIEQSFDHEEEFESRLKISQCGIPVVAKYMPISHSVEKEIEIVSRLINCFDKVYLFNRENVKDHALSIAICHKVNLWNKSSLQDELIEKSLTNKIVIDEKELVNITDNFKRFHEIMKRCHTEKVSIIPFEKLIQIKDGVHFCKFFDLENINFTFYDVFEEYGERKKSIIEIIQNG